MDVEKIFSECKTYDEFFAQVRTYRAGLMQAKAFRVVSKHFNENLAAKNLSVPEWAVLGLLYETQEHLPMSAISHMLGVENPMTTSIVKSLEEKGLAARFAQDKDRRSRYVELTDAGRKFVPKTEAELNKRYKEFMQDSTVDDLYSYVTVINFLASKY